MPRIFRRLALIAGIVAIGCLNGNVIAVADEIDGRELADEYCNSCHVQAGQTVGLGQAPELSEGVQKLDWSHLRLREWFATGHPTRISFQLTDLALHDLRLYLIDLRSQSMLGGLATP